MVATFQIIALSALDPDCRDRDENPKLPYPDALMTAKQFQFQGMAFRVFGNGEQTDDQMKSFRDLGALIS
jgi:hypothetical protein